MTDTLRRQMNAEVTGRVRITSITKTCISQAAELTLHPINDTVSHRQNYKSITTALCFLILSRLNLPYHETRPK